MKENRLHDALVRVDWISPHPNHYHSYLLDKLMVVPDVTVRPIYVRGKLALYPWKTEFLDDQNVYVLKTRFGIDWKVLITLLQSKGALPIIAGWNVPTCFLVITLLAMLNRTFILYSDTPDVHKMRVGWAQSLRGIWLKWVYGKMWKHFITGDVGVRALLRQGVRRSKIINFPFATNLEFFVPTETIKNDDVITLFSSGRLDIAHKGYDVILRSLANLRTAQTRFRFEYLIAGSGPDEAAMMKLINRYGLSDNVKILGWVEPDELLELYQAADFFVHPSNFDPFPNAVLEAMACGLPVIGSDLAGSVIDRVFHGVSGFVFRAGDHVDLQKQIIKAFNLPKAERRQMSLACRDIALRWDVNHNITEFQKIVKIYQRWKAMVINKNAHA
jgi:glycosyltransferase involved in cell wall biosynthesis